VSRMLKCLSECCCKSKPGGKMNLHFAAGYFADNPYFPAHHANCLVQNASISPHFFGKRRPARPTQICRLNSLSQPTATQEGSQIHIRAKK
jgi:hypothetical protein